MSIKIGQKIKLIVEQKGLTPTTFAKKIHKDRTTVYQIFDRESIDTDLLLFIGRVLNYNFFQELADEQAKTMDKILEEKPKLVSIDEVEGWKVKCYELTKELSKVQKDYIELLKEKQTDIIDFSKISMNEQTLP